MRTTQDFEELKAIFGSSTINGVEYALIDAPEIVNYQGRAVFAAPAFPKPDSDDPVTLKWDCEEWYNDPSSADDFDCDWENEAFI